MEMSHHSIFRPATPLVVAIALMVSLACGTAAEPNPAESTQPAASASTGSIDTNRQAHGDQSGSKDQGQSPQARS